MKTNAGDYALLVNGRRRRAPTVRLGVNGERERERERYGNLGKNLKQKCEESKTFFIYAVLLWQG